MRNIRGINPERLLFVYGTLRKGHERNYVLDEIEAEFLGYVETKPEWHFVNLNNFPGLIAKGNTVVTGELYLLKEGPEGPQGQRALDYIEGHPHLYRRRLIDLQNVNQQVTTYVFVAKLKNLNKYISDNAIASGDWSQYFRDEGRYERGC